VKPHPPIHPLTRSDDLWEAKLVTLGGVLPEEQWILLPYLLQRTLQHPQRHKHTCRAHTTKGFIPPQNPWQQETTTQLQHTHENKTAATSSPKLRAIV